MELLWFLLCVAALIPFLIVARRESNREIREMTPQEREQDRYQEQLW